LKNDWNEDYAIPCGLASQMRPLSAAGRLCGNYVARRRDSRWDIHAIISMSYDNR